MFAALAAPLAGQAAGALVGGIGKLFGRSKRKKARKKKKAAEAAAAAAAEKQRQDALAESDKQRAHELQLAQLQGQAGQQAGLGPPTMADVPEEREGPPVDGPGGRQGKGVFGLSPVVIVGGGVAVVLVVIILVVAFRKR